MDFMGMGPLEILLVLIIGFLFLGPEKLPGVAAKAGEMYRKFTKAAFDLSKSITEEISSETKIMGKEVSTEAKSIVEEIATEAKSIVEEVNTDTKTTNPDKSPQLTEGNKRS